MQRVVIMSNTPQTALIAIGKISKAAVKTIPIMITRAKGARFTCGNSMVASSRSNLPSRFIAEICSRLPCTNKTSPICNLTLSMLLMFASISAPARWKAKVKS